MPDLKDNPPDSDNPIVKVVSWGIASILFGALTYKFPEKVCSCTGWKWAFAIAGIIVLGFIVNWIWENWVD